MENKNYISESSSQQDERSPATDTRRSFLKKAVYSAPVLLIMGQLALPAQVGADNSLPGPFRSRGESGRPPKYK